MAVYRIVFLTIAALAVGYTYTLVKSFEVLA